MLDLGIFAGMATVLAAASACYWGPACSWDGGGEGWSQIPHGLVKGLSLPVFTDPADLAFVCLLLNGKLQPGRPSQPGAGRARPAPSPGAPVLCLKAGLPSLSPHLASTVTAKSKKPGDGCQGNLPTLIPSINHRLSGHQGPCLRRTGDSEVSAGAPNLCC